MDPREQEARLQAHVGRVLGDKYRLRACVGIGGTGAVYRADQIALGRTVAVKLLAEELADDAKLIKRFHDEALAASRLNHPNTVSVIDYGQAPDGLLYLVMEFVRGPTLTQLIQQGHPLELDRVLDIVGQIVSGIEEAHLNGVVHADLKSDNVIVDQRRVDWDVVKLVDFGIARLLFQPSEEERNICGTPEYMAPETITGAPPSFASDLYSVGVIFYELLVGETPFVGGTTVEILTRQLRQAPAPPNLRRAGLPPDIESVCMRALAKHPADRYPDAAAFRKAIQQLRDARRVVRSANMAICDACSAQIPARFRFCPECGQPRTAPPPAAGGQLAEVEPSSPAIVLPTVGRESALEIVAAHLKGTDAPAVLHLSGVPGSGRSQLLRDAYQQAIADGRTVYQAGPDPSGLRTPLYPVRAAVAAALVLPAVCTFDELGRAATELGLSERDLPGLAELFGHVASLADLEPMVRRREMVASTVRALHAAASAGPMVAVFENVEQYDHPSQEVLRRLAERSDECPVLRVVVTSTPELAGQWRGAAALIEVEPLDEVAVERLIDELERAGVGERPAADELLAFSGGLPGPIDQALRYIQEGGELDDTIATAPDLIAARISLLPQSALELLQAAAVFGYDVDRDVLVRASEMGPRAFESTLSVLTARDLVREAEGVVAFGAATVRDVVYHGTPADVRRHLHGVAAELLSQVTGDPAILGHHHDLAGSYDQGADFLARAGDVAAHYLDDEGACALYQRALHAARLILYAGDEDRDVQRYVGLSVKLAEALCAGGQLGLARGVLEEARPWTSGSARLEAQVGRAAAQLSLGEDDVAGATTAVRRAIGAAISTGDGTLITELYLDLASILTRGGDADGARRELEEGVDLVTLGEGMGARGGPPELWRMLARLSQLASGAGDHGRAIMVAEHGLAHARRVSSRVGSARVLVLLAGECERVGDVARAGTYRAAAVEELRALGDRRTTAELLMTIVSPSRTLSRIPAPALTEARELASEIGWHEGLASGGES